MYRWLVARLIRWAVTGLISGRNDIGLRLMADDVRFVFPGRSEWAADVSSRQGMEAWLRRFVAAGPDYVIDDVIVSGPPWNTRAAVRFHDRIGSDYSNEGMQYLTLRWGRVTSDRVYLDTEAVAELDRRHPELGRAVPA